MYYKYLLCCFAILRQNPPTPDLISTWGSVASKVAVWSSANNLLPVQSPVRQRQVSIHILFHQSRSEFLCIARKNQTRSRFSKHRDIERCSQILLQVQCFVCDQWRLVAFGKLDQTSFQHTGKSSKITSLNCMRVKDDEDVRMKHYRETRNVDRYLLLWLGVK